MKQWVVGSVSVLVTALVFLGAGVEIGAKMTRVEVVSAAEVGRFQRMTDTTALDTKLGIVCSTVSGIQIDPQTGERIHNTLPLCAGR